MENQKLMMSEVGMAASMKSIQTYMAIPAGRYTLDISVIMIYHLIILYPPHSTTMIKSCIKRQ